MNDTALRTALLVYAPDGLMSAGISRSGRAPFASASAGQLRATTRSPVLAPSSSTPQALRGGR